MTQSVIIYQKTSWNFNPHLRVGGDVLTNIPPSLFSYFNPHLRVGGDTDLEGATSRVNDFNPHLRVGGDLYVKRAKHRGH